MLSRLVLAATLAVASGAAPQAPQRFALLVGNAQYQSLPPLAAAESALGPLETALRGARFNVTRRDNLKRQEYIDLLLQFLDPVHDGDAVLVYFAGYTAEVDGDDNYLLPVDFAANSDRPMAERAIPLKAIQQRADRKSHALKILMLEAPYNLAVNVRGATDSGVQQPNPYESRETLLAFAASPGHAVQMPAGAALFTREVAANITKAGASMRSVFEEAKSAVARATAGNQIPLVADNVTATFFFHDPEPTKPIEPVKPEVITIVKEAPLRPGFPATNSRDKEDYRWIPPGKFKMGCVAPDQRCLPNEQPQHEVTISKGLWMGRNEVQVSSYQRYVQAQSAPGKKKLSMPAAPMDYDKWRKFDYPMVNVSWQDAQAYCTWAGGRLPTEAEWEYGARAGQDAIYPFDGPNSRDKANFAGRQGADIFDRVAPVHSFDANAWGLNDMAGNVWEWVLDLYSKDYYQSSPARDPQGPDSGKDHVMRGGSFDSDAEKHLRISVRREGAPGNAVGFRCVLEDSPATNTLLGR